MGKEAEKLLLTPTPLYIGKKTLDQKFQSKLGPEILVPIGNSDPMLDRKFRLPAEPKLPGFKDLCVRESVWLLDEKA